MNDPIQPYISSSNLTSEPTSQSQTSQPVEQPVTLNTSNIDPINVPKRKLFSKRNFIFFGLVLLFILFSSLKLNLKFTANFKKPLTGTKPIALIEDLSKYEVDTDGDKIPDFVEKELKLDQNNNDILSCYKDTCDDSTISKGQVKNKNILLIVDGSGSMNTSIGSESKMEAAKKAVVKYVGDTKGSANLGLMTYGNKGSNSPNDKSISCNSVDVISPIGDLNMINAQSNVNQLKPVGWTPIGLAIKNASEAFVGKENDINQLVILTDGEETCNTNPVEEARVLANSPYKVKITLIGFGTTFKEQESLRQISSAGGGDFYSASSSYELEDVFKKQWDTYNSVRSELDCKAGSLQDSIKCTGNLYKMLSAYELANLSPKVGKSVDEHRKLNNMLTEFSSYKNKIMTEKSDEFAKRAKEQSEKLFK